MKYDIDAFRAINSLAGRVAAADAFFIFCATGAPFLMIAIIIGYAAIAWKTPSFQERLGNCLQAAWAAAIGFAMERTIGFLWFRPRPFAALDHVIKLADRSPQEKSFPSGHATFAFALAFSLARHDKKRGASLLALAVLVAFGRVAAGVHYPSDVVGGAIVGFLAAWLAAPAKRAFLPYIGVIAHLRSKKQENA